MALADTARLIASLELQDKFSKPAAGAGRALDGLERKTSSLGRIGNQASKGLGNLANSVKTIGMLAGGLAVTGIVASVRAASDLNETISKVGVVFGDAAARVLAFGETSASALGLSKNAALAGAATFGNLFVSMGLASDKSADMSLSLVKLASDLASFNNIDPAEALEKLRAGLTGESEPLKSLGININETIIKAKALELGLVKTTASTADLTVKQQALDKANVALSSTIKKYGVESQEALAATIKQEKAQGDLEAATNRIPAVLDAATKAQAAYALITEQSATAQGDFSRTSTGLANQQRILRANLENTGATIGTALLPKIGEVAQKINKLIVENQPAIEKFAATLPAAFDKLVAFGGQLPWGAIADAFRVMGTGSKALLDAFLGLPPWVQTAVLTGWGLNKLTGGALGNITGELAKGLIKGVLGMNAGVVNINAATVNGGVPGVVGAGAGGSIIRSFLGVGTAIGLGAILGREIGHSVFFDPTIKPAVEFEQRQFDELIDRSKPDELRHAIAELDKNIKGFEFGRDLPIVGGMTGFLEDFLVGDQIQLLKDQKALAEAQLAELVKANQGTTGGARGAAAGVGLGAPKNGTLGAAAGLGLGAPKPLPDTALSAIERTPTAINKLPPILSRQERQLQTLHRAMGEVRAAQMSGNSKLGIIAAKPAPVSNVKVNVAVTTNLSVDNVLRKITSAWIASGKVGAMTDLL